MSQLVVKKVRFATDDPVQFTIDKPILTNTYQPIEYCNQCGSARFGAPSVSGCKNCLIPKPAIKTPNLRDRNQFVSKSDQSLNTISQNNNKNNNYSLTHGINSLINSNSLSNGNKNNINNSNGIFIEFENQQIPNYLKNSTNAAANAARSRDSISTQSINTRADDFSNLKLNSNEYPIPKPRKFNDLSTKTDFVWKCYNCNEILKPGEIAISAEHVDPTARWHTKCFTCCVCNELLVDLLYYNRDNKVFCQKHYSETKPKQPICAACDLPIKTFEYVKAEGYNWHIEHFICWKCETPLGGQKYIVVESKPYCFECHASNFAKMCHTCRQKIPPDLVRLTYDSLNWHAVPDCFKCFTCNKSLLESHFLLKNNLLFCSLDCKNQVSIV